MSTDYSSHTIEVQGIETHYLEAGTENEEVVVLIHSGEYGASAELSWETTIPGLAEEYHVIAPDLLGYGQTDKIFDFEDMYDRRIKHIGAFLDTLCITEAKFVGNSMGAGYLGSLACEEPPLEWPIEEMVLISGGGTTPEGFLKIIQEFDGTEEEMKKILDELYYDPESLDDSFLKRKVEQSRVPGHWQSLSAMRFNPPFEQERDFRRQHDYENIDLPALIIGGEEDNLHPKEELLEVAEEMGAETKFFEKCKHTAHIEYPDEVQELILEFFDS